MQILKMLALVSVITVLPACKLALIVVEGGYVTGSNGGGCQVQVPQLWGSACLQKINDTDYSNTFTAVPDPGWQFVKWYSGPGFLCGGSNNPGCAVSTVGTEGNATAEAIIASDSTVYLMPIFARTTPAAPITKTVIVNGNEWAQPIEFLALKRSEIAAVCPAGVCSGSLNGFDMNGWTWASSDDVNALFNHYIGSDELGPGPDWADLPSIFWHSQFFMQFQNTSIVNSHLAIEGWLRECSFIEYLAGNNGHLGSIIVYEDGGNLTSNPGTAPTSVAPDCEGQENGIGAWFYRPVP